MPSLSDFNSTWQLLQRISLLMQAELRRVALEHDLQDVHLHILIFLHDANRYSNTLAAVTEYLGSTKGTASQSISLLEKKGFLQRVADVTDRRISRLLLTPAGEQVISLAASDNIIYKTLASHEGPREQLQMAGNSLRELLRLCQLHHGRKAFGVCRSCCHHIENEDGSRHCGLTSEALSDAESFLICREYEPEIRKGRT